jgi:hypothetical protein
MMKEENPEAVPLPEGVSEPGFYPESTLYPQLRASAELATFATGWAFLHEIRHLQHQQEMTSSGIDASTSEQHAEEFSCDEFATKFMLDRIDHYAERENVSADRVRQKRKTGTTLPCSLLHSSDAAIGGHRAAIPPYSSGLML